MTRIRRRRRVDSEDSQAGGASLLFGWMPPGVLWTVLALGVVLLVWSYDRSAHGIFIRAACRTRFCRKSSNVWV